MTAAAAKPDNGSEPQGCVAWVTGLPASGKTTFARAAARALSSSGVAACILDGDELRAALVPPPGYGPEARDAFYATLARVAALLASQGLVVLVPATAHRAAYRAEARRRAPTFLEIYVATDSATCAGRDLKGLYAAARAGDLRGLPGRDVTYEAPEVADVVARSGLDVAAVEQLVNLVRTLVRPASDRGAA